MSYTGGHRQLGGLTDIASAATAVVSDPCLPELTGHVLELQAIYAKKGPQPAPGKPPTPTKGVGLCYAVTPVKLFKFHVKNPWFIPMVGASVLAGLYWLGYDAGRRK